MVVLGRIEGYFARLQFERRCIIRLEKERALQHVNGLIARMEMFASDAAGRDIGEEYDDFFVGYLGHRLAQYFRPRYLGCSLRADKGGPANPDRHAGKTGTEKQKCFVHGSLLLIDPLHPLVTYAPYV